MTPVDSQSRRRGRIIALLALLLTAAVYIPGITGGFIFDDYANIVLNDKLHLDQLAVDDLLEAGWSGVAGPLKRPVAMISFALNYATTGEFVVAFKITNLLIHLINGILIYVFARLLLGAHCNRIGRNDVNVEIVAALAAAVWLVHPLNLTSILYVVQRMTSLAAMFSLLAIISYCAGRRRMVAGESGAWWPILIGVPVATALGMLSKENAALTLPLLGIVEFCVFRFAAVRTHDRFVLQGLFVAILVLPALVSIAYVAVEPGFLSQRFDTRPFTLMERVLTEARVLWFYLTMLLIPRLGQLALHHDDYTLSTGLFEPAVTSVAVGGVLLAAIIALAAVRRAPMLSFAIGWFLVGHAMESSVVALELVHEHRNYLPTGGVVIALTYGTAAMLKRCTPTALPGRVIATTVIGLLAALTALRASDWGDPVTLARIEAARHPNSYRSVYELGRIEFGLYKTNRREVHFENSLAALERSATLDSNATSPYAALIKLAYARGLEPKPQWRAELLQRYRHGVFQMVGTLDLHQMVKCRAERVCEIPAQEILEFYFAALSNPTLRGYAKSQLMIDLAVFYVNEASDLEPAIRLLDDAIALNPDEFDFRKTRLEVYLLAGRVDDAAAELERIRSTRLWRDKLHPPVAEIEGLKRKLDELRSRTPKS